MKKSYFGLVLTVFVLAGCTGAPSDSDIKNALDKAVLQQEKMMESIGGGKMKDMFKVEYTSVKKISCKDDGEKAYLCDVEATAKTVTGEHKETSSIRLVNGSDGWVAAR